MGSMLVLRRGHQALHHIATRVGRLPGDDFVQNRAEQVHIARLLMLSTGPLAISGAMYAGVPPRLSAW